MSVISTNPITDLNSLDLAGKEQAQKSQDNKVQTNLVNERSQIQAVQSVDEKEAVENQISHEQLEMVAQQLQDFVGKMNKGLEFTVDQDSGRDVIKVIDKSNGDLIKQYPSEEVLDLVSKLSQAAGAFINEQI